MLVNGSGIRIIDALTAQMKHLTSRQQVIAQNIANADTPGYRSHDLAEPDFAKILGRTAGRHDRTVTQPAVTITPRMTARSEEHTSELQSLMRISYAVF